MLNFWGGKDSTAMLLFMLERGLQVDDILFCDTGLEFPELYQHLKDLEKYINRPITVLHPQNSFEYYLAKIIKTKGDHAGEAGYGWVRKKNQRWCTGVLKEKVANKYLKSRYKDKSEYTLYIGIAADEPERHYREQEKNIRHPLFEWGITEAMALDYCRKKGFDFGGLYDKFDRLGCWCCPLQSKAALKTLRKYYPVLWQELQRLDAKSPNTFKDRYSIATLERRFAIEDAHIDLFKTEVKIC